MKTFTMITLCALTLGLTACGGGGADVKTHNTTMGQELVDLKKAHDEGLITDREYKNAKRDIMDMYDN